MKRHTWHSVRLSTPSFDPKLLAKKFFRRFDTLQKDRTFCGFFLVTTAVVEALHRVGCSLCVYLETSFACLVSFHSLILFLRTILYSYLSLDN